MIRCPKCRGQKKIMTIGLMELDCLTCHGKGSIAKPPVQTVDKKQTVKAELSNPIPDQSSISITEPPISDTQQTVKDIKRIIPKKRGRPSVSKEV